MSYVEMEQAISCQQMEIEDLRQQLAAANAEIERLNASPTIEACRQMIRDKAVIEASELHNQLAASQAREKQLREYIGAAYKMATESPDNQPFDWAVFCEMLHTALTLPTDTTALEAIVAKTGEVMLERAAKHISATEWLFANKSDPKAAHYYISPQARALQTASLGAIPGVTLEDLK